MYIFPFCLLKHRAHLQHLWCRAHTLLNAVRRYHILNGFYTTDIYLLWFWRLEVRHEGASLVRGGPLPDTDFSFCPSVAEGVRELHGLFFIRAFTPYMRAAPSRSIPSQRPHLPTLSHWLLELQHVNLRSGRHKHTDGSRG